MLLSGQALSSKERDRGGHVSTILGLNQLLPEILFSWSYYETAWWRFIACVLFLMK